MLKENDKRTLDEMVENGDGIENLTYLQLGKLLTELGWHIDWVILGNIYEYLDQYREEIESP